VVKLKNPKEMTSEHKFLLIIFKTTRYYVPGDERSRTNPGHGYPEHTNEINSTEAYAFVNHQELELELLRLYEEDRKRKDLLVIDVANIVPVKVSLGIQFN